MSVRSGTAPPISDQGVPTVPGPGRSHVGGVVVGSLAVGFVAALVFPFLPVGTVDVNFSSAMVLFGWALGWALLALLNVRQAINVDPAFYMNTPGGVASADVLDPRPGAGTAARR